MNFAAQAVIEMVAPPAQTAGGDAAADGAAFDARLAQAAALGAATESAANPESEGATTAPPLPTPWILPAPAPATPPVTLFPASILTQLTASPSDAPAQPIVSDPAALTAPLLGALQRNTGTSAAETAATPAPARTSDAGGEADKPQAAQAAAAPSLKDQAPATRVQQAPHPSAEGAVGPPAAPSTAKPAAAERAPAGKAQQTQPAAAPQPQPIMSTPPSMAAAKPLPAASAHAELITAAKAQIAAPQLAQAPDARRLPHAGKSDAARDAAQAPQAHIVGKPQAAQPQGRGSQTPSAGEAMMFALADAPEGQAQSSVQQSALQPGSALTLAGAQTTHAVQGQHAALDHAAARAAPAAAQVAREIVRRFDGANTRFEVRLDPPELGRVEVRLDVSRDQRVTAVVAADTPQALTELARHARELEQSLQSAGLELADNGLSFDLRQGHASDERGARESGADGDELAGQIETDTPRLARPLGLERWRGVRIDMMV